MPDSSATPPQPVEIRKYPNRRYYDSSRSRHLTLEEIRGLIRDGHTVRITDSETSADITGRVLTQIILELDTPKIELFPVPLLQEVIRVNDQMMKGYLDRFFRQTSEGFVAFLKQFEDPLRGGLFPGVFPSFNLNMPWATPAASAPKAESPGPATPPPPPSNRTAEPGLGDALAALRREVATLQSELAKARRPRGSIAPPVPRSRARAKRKTASAKPAAARSSAAKRAIRRRRS